MSITRRSWSDDTGPGTDGSILNNVELQAIYDTLDARWSVATIVDTGTQNNLSISEADFVIFNNASDLTITGLVAPASPTKPGKPVRFICIGAGNVFFAHENAGSTAANRLNNIATSINTPFAGGSGRGMVTYDSVASRWRLIVHEQGAAIAYTPTWGNSGTANTLGNGTVTGSYIVRGRQVFIRVSFTFGSTSSAGSGTYTFTTPFTANASSGVLGAGYLFDSSAALLYGAVCALVSTTTFNVINTDASTAGASGTVPFAWATSDLMNMEGRMEVA